MQRSTKLLTGGTAILPNGQPRSTNGQPNGQPNSCKGTNSKKLGFLFKIIRIIDFNMCLVLLGPWLTQTQSNEARQSNDEAKRSMCLWCLCLCECCVDSEVTESAHSWMRIIATKLQENWLATWAQGEGCPATKLAHSRMRISNNTDVLCVVGLFCYCTVLL